jgi:hypothetical protein
MKKTLQQHEEDMREWAMCIITRSERVEHEYGKEDANKILNGIIQYLQEQQQDLFN